jgi:hypothetical protein
MKQIVSLGKADEGNNILFFIMVLEYRGCHKQDDHFN